MQVILDLKNDKAVIPFKTHEQDFCYDVIATSEEEVAPNVWRYGLGFAYEINRDRVTFGEIPIMSLDGSKMYGIQHKTIENWMYNCVNLSLDFRPRSSIWKTGMVLSNSVGTLDELYRGEAQAVFYHIMPNMPRYKVGDKIGQIKLGITLPLEFVEGEINYNTDRGTGGFGSTGR